ncbi:MAG: anhydro-N-acetylmuramic acid kinase [Bacteroidia bacterium]
MKVLGLMSGTSLDGLDLAIAEFKGLPMEDSPIKWQIHAVKTIRYSDEWISRLAKSINLSGLDLMLLHTDYGSLLGETCLEFINEIGITPDLISSHGHTIFHEPKKGFTTQIGDGNQIASITGISTAYNFRSLDVALGGQGAPLVPIGDQYLFDEYDACLNLGGIANISYNENGKRIGFDICPFNLLLNYFANKLGVAFDKGGNLARQGFVDLELLAQLNSIEYYQKAYPKSLDKETLLKQYLVLIGSLNSEPKNVLATLVEHYTNEIAKHLSGKNCLITGGGAYNSFFIESLKSKSEVNIHVPGKELIEFKEALIFAFIGYLRVNRVNNILSSATGAKSDSCSGLFIQP